MAFSGRIPVLNDSTDAHECADSDGMPGPGDRLRARQMAGRGEFLDPANDPEFGKHLYDWLPPWADLRSSRGGTL